MSAMQNEKKGSLNTRIKWNAVFFVCTVLAVILRVICLDFKSEDYIKFLSEWVTFFKENGGWSALKYSVGDYNVIYQYILIVISYIDINPLYLIKLVSIIFDFVLASGCVKLLGEFGVSRLKRKICFFVILLLPTVWINSAFWSQCDAVYVSLIVWGIYFLIKEKSSRAMAMLSLAFAFKLQTVFIMPVFAVAFFKGKIKWQGILAFAGTYILTCVPALLAGKSFMELVGIYLNQTSEYPLMVMNAPSVFRMFNIVDFNPLTEKLFIIAALSLTLAIMVWGILSKGDFGIIVLKLGMVFSLLIPFLLPHMHERYFFLADILAIVCTFAFGKKYLMVAGLMQTASLICYMQYFDYINLYAPKFLTWILTGGFSAILVLAALLMAVVLYAADKSGKTTVLKGTAIIIFAAVFILQSIVTDRYLVSFNGRLTNFTVVQPYEYGGTVMLPLRNMCSIMRTSINYDEMTGSIKLITPKNDIIRIKQGVDTANINGEEVTLNTPYIVCNTFAYMSADDIAKLFSLQILKDKNIVKLVSEEYRK